ncbi:hypothetical protein KCX70_15800 [Stutzerimonas stutzeri]|jgi:hypothetical protein|uniref:hypothetical protein n=1 Tax=Stutzerimonas stutzeri group TaxID=136846 RepID=UPI000CC3B6F3|nr:MULTISPECIES: hypothetical protein [Stutzerimonas stutzeri group]PKM28456.1 MAG: hypothetical protein CVV07_14130 [Gammaproteobacteria bacterium HGW-Gammaproteobacteria-11]QTF58226.1 hypothetical protein J4H94_06780 [Stutzerimonas frequens]QUE74717.1 hypothetical protein KCX70_15800 [Stutzerimonas stutzeri]
MSPFALVVSLILAFAIGISWLALAVDARIARGRLIRQIPLPLDYSGSGRRRSRLGLRPVMAVSGCLLVLLSSIEAAVLGRLATMQPAEAAAVFIAYPLLKNLWGQVMGAGPIVCVVLAVPGTYCISVGLGSDRG